MQDTKYLRFKTYGFSRGLGLGFSKILYQSQEGFFGKGQFDLRDTLLIILVVF